jgi:ribulose-5-phosphate 4-epimerase/fuculose-1-phosphate aldolase
MDSADDLETQRRAIADGCRILAREGLVTATLGHISARAGDGMLLRTRGPDDRGLQFATADDVKLVPLDAVEGRIGTHRIPVEAPLHGETLRRRPGVGAVVHAHPPAVVACTIAGLPLLPIIGAYDIPAARMAHDGIPVFDRSVLIRNADVASKMLVVMGEAPACLLAGHGLVVVGSTVAQAVTRAISINNLAQLTLMVAATGKPLTAIPEADFAELPDLGPGMNDDPVWRHYLARARLDKPPANDR